MWSHVVFNARAVLTNDKSCVAVKLNKLRQPLHSTNKKLLSLFACGRATKADAEVHCIVATTTITSSYSETVGSGNKRKRKTSTLLCCATACT